MSVIFHVGINLQHSISVLLKKLIVAVLISRSNFKCFLFLFVSCMLIAFCKLEYIIFNWS